MRGVRYGTLSAAVRLFACILTTLLSLALIGCSKEGRIKNYITDLNSENVQIIEEAQNELIRIGPETIEPLSAALHTAVDEDNENTQVNIVNVLINIRDASVSEPLIYAALHGSIGSLSEKAVKISLQNNSDSIRILAEGLWDSDETVRRNAQQNLVLTGESCIGILDNYLQTALKDRNIHVQEGVIYVYSALKSSTTVDSLTQAALYTSDSKIHSQALELLEVLGRVNTSLMIEALGDADANIQQNAVDALMKFRESSTESIAEAALSSQDPNVKRNALAILEKFGDDRALEGFTQYIVTYTSYSSFKKASTDIYISGKILVIDIIKNKVDPMYWKIPEQIRVSAGDPGGAKAIVLLKWGEENVGDNSSDEGQAYELTCNVTVIDIIRKVIIAEKYFRGGEPPFLVYRGDPNMKHYGSSPEEDVLKYILSLVKKQ